MATNHATPHDDDDESHDQSTTDLGADDAEVTNATDQHGPASLPDERRTDTLERDGYRCQVCGREGPEQGGLATLHVHHAERDPDGVAEDSPANLTTLCRSCHSWVHQQATRDDAPVTLTAADRSELLPQDIEILQCLAEHGPAGTSEVADALTADLSPTAVRERLAALMGLDKQVDGRDQQLVDQDVDTGVWGLTEQIEHSARGHIPSDPQTLIQRVEDEQVRQALERGCDRQPVMDVLDVSRRSTFHKEKRARAYDLPLDALRRSGDGGQHPEGSASSDETPETDDQSGRGDGGEQRQAVLGDEVTEETEQAGRDAAETAQSRDDTDDDDGDLMLREQLQTAITALQQINAEL